MSYNIAIDGPAGAGKSTIARRAAAALSFIYVDTGAMYRAMGLYFLNHGIDPADTAAIEAAVQDVDVSIRYENGEQQVYLNGENVTGQIRREEVGDMASRTSVNGKVREKLVQLQQQLAARENVVMDGRDIGTCVLPDATVKIYLTASVEERARRRYLELKEKGQEEPGENPGGHPRPGSPGYDQGDLAASPGRGRGAGGRLPYDHRRGDGGGA